MKRNNTHDNEKYTVSLVSMQSDNVLLENEVIGTRAADISQDTMLNAAGEGFYTEVTKGWSSE